MNLRQLEVFQAVMQTANMSAAGKLLALTPSAVSKAISHAELQLGYKLFVRGQRGLVPTPEARVLFGEAAQIYGMLDGFKKTAKNLKLADKGTLRIAAIPAICHEFLPSVLAQYMKLYPHIDIEVRTLHKSEMAQILLNRGVDFALAHYPLSHPLVVSQVLASHALYIAVGRDIWMRAIKARPSNPMSFFSKVPLIKLLSDDPLSQMIENLSTQREGDLVSNIKVQTSRMALELVKLGMGWTVVDFLTARNLNRDTIVTMELQGQDFIPICAYSASDAPASQHALNMLEMLAQALRNPRNAPAAADKYD
jgi:DNA-binding transcriptional LysR family regulator